jgi:hypothetical protein
MPGLLLLVVVLVLQLLGLLPVGLQRRRLRKLLVCTPILLCCLLLQAGPFVRARG